MRFWDLKEHKQTAVVSLPGRKARAVGYSHDGSAVAVGFMDGERGERVDSQMAYHSRLSVLYGGRGRGKERKGEEERGRE